MRGEPCRGKVRTSSGSVETEGGLPVGCLRVGCLPVRGLAVRYLAVWSLAAAVLPQHRHGRWGAVLQPKLLRANM